MADSADITRALKNSWSSETSYDGENYDDTNPPRGQCVVSSLVVQDYLGGDLVRVAVSGGSINEKHYFNRLDDGTIIDVTRSQYLQPVTMTDSPVDLVAKGYVSNRERMLADDDTRSRYEILRQKVTRELQV